MDDGVSGIRGEDDGQEPDVPQAAPPVLEVEDLHVSYGARVAVDGVSFRIDRGEIFGLLGPNGAGKTSTLSAIEGLVKPKSGSSRIDGIDTERHPLDAKARLGVQLQSSSFQAELSILQIAQLYAGLYGVRLSRDEIGDGMRTIGLDAEMDKRFKQLSGGQQQRLALFIASIHDPLLLLLDEPTAGLDPQSRRARRSAQGRAIRRTGASVVAATDASSSPRFLR